MEVEEDALDAAERSARRLAKKLKRGTTGPAAALQSDENVGLLYDEAILLHTGPQDPSGEVVGKKAMCACQILGGTVQDVWFCEHGGGDPALNASWDARHIS